MFEGVRLTHCLTRMECHGEDSLCAVPQKKTNYGEPVWLGDLRDGCPSINNWLKATI